MSSPDPTPVTGNARELTLATLACKLLRKVQIRTTIRRMQQEAADADDQHRERDRHAHEDQREQDPEFAAAEIAFDQCVDGDRPAVDGVRRLRTAFAGPVHRPVQQRLRQLCYF